MNLLCDALEQMVVDIRRHDRAQVFVEWKGAPLAGRSQREIELKFQRQLPSDVAGFYGQWNGYALLWGLREGEPGARIPPNLPPLGQKPEWSPLFQDFGTVGGCMYLPPLEQVLLAADWMYEFHGGPDDDELLRIYGREAKESVLWSSVRPFDMADGYFNGAFLLLEEEPFSVIVIDDQGACITDSRLTTFAEYMESCVATHADQMQRGTNYVLGSLQRDRIPMPSQGWPRMTVDDVLSRVAKVTGMGSPDRGEG